MTSTAPIPRATPKSTIRRSGSNFPAINRLREIQEFYRWSGTNVTKLTGTQPLSVTE